MKNRIALILLSHIKVESKTSFLANCSDLFRFYTNRLKDVPNYGLVQGRELIKMICRSAFNDSSLTDNEAIVIMETCLDPALDNILLEVNFNEGW